MRPAVLAILFVILVGNGAYAAGPAYTALQRSGAYTGCAEAPAPRVVKAQPYPYGYFGAVESRGHWSHSTGYYGLNPQWIRR